MLVCQLDNYLNITEKILARWFFTKPTNWSRGMQIQKQTCIQKVITPVSTNSVSHWQVIDVFFIFREHFALSRVPAHQLQSNLYCKLDGTVSRNRATTFSKHYDWSIQEVAAKKFCTYADIRTEYPRQPIILKSEFFNMWVCAFVWAQVVCSCWHGSVFAFLSVFTTLLLLLNINCYYYLISSSLLLLCTVCTSFLINI